MINNSTNINKMNSIKTPKPKIPQHLTLVIEILLWDKHRQVAELIRLLRSWFGTGIDMWQG
jgi:hypothetical protein